MECVDYWLEAGRGHSESEYSADKIGKSLRAVCAVSFGRISNVRSSHGRIDLNFLLSARMLLGPPTVPNLSRRFDWCANPRQKSSAVVAKLADAHA